jgi:hypothetical protein
LAIEKTIVIKADTSDAEQSFEDLGKVIQEQIDITIQFEKELEELEQQLKDTPKGNLSAQKDLKDRIGGLKTAIGEQKTALKGLNNERGKASKALKSNFEEVTKNGGAIALLDTVTGGMASRTRDAFEATKLFNFSLKGTRTALIATGIGAFVVALGLVVAYWDDIVEFIGGANKKMREQIALGQKHSSNLSFQLEVLELQKTVLENQGKSTKEIEETIAKTLEEQLIQLETTLLQQQEYDKTLGTKEAELSIWNKIQLAAGGTLGTVSLINEEEKTAREEREKGIQDTIKAIEQIRVKQSESDKEKREAEQEYRDLVEENNAFFAAEADKRIAKNKEEADKRFDFENSINERLRTLDAKTREEKLQLEQQRLQEDLDNLIGTETQKHDAQLALDILFFEQDEALKEEQRKEAKAASDAFFAGEADDAIAADKAVKDAKKKADEQEAKDKETLRNQEQAALVATISIAQNLLSGAAKKNKGIAVAQALINTFLGISAGVKLGYPAAIPAVIAAAATGFKAVQDIQKTDEKGGGSSSASFTGASFTPQAPQFNLVQGTGANQIAESITQQAPLEAFVVSSNVTTSQSLDRNIVEDATI